MNTRFIFAAALLSTALLQAHIVFPNKDAPELTPLDDVSFIIVVQHDPGEPCTVTASGEASSDLVTVEAVGPTNGLDVVFVATIARDPNGSSEEATITIDWFADPKHDTCNGVGTAEIKVEVFEDAPPEVTPTYSSEDEDTGEEDDPISTATGELFGYDAQADLEPGGPMHMSFRRYYASLLSKHGVFGGLGLNWMHNYDTRLKLVGKHAVVTLFGGKTVGFKNNGSTWQLVTTERRPYQLATVGSGYQFLNPASNLIYSFDSAGRLTSIADRNGNTLTVTQAPGGAGPAQVSDGYGRTLTFTYQGTSLVSVQDQSGRTVSFEYGGVTLSAWTNANGKRAVFNYTSAGESTSLLTSETRPAGNHPFNNSVDSAGRVVTQSDSFGHSVSLAYAPANGGATITEPAGVTLTEGHDAHLNMTSLSDPSGSSTYAYDANYRPTSVVNRLGAKSSATWDPASGILASYTDELGHAISYTWAASSFGPFTVYDLSSIHFADGHTVSFARDNNGNVTSINGAAGKTWQATFATNGLIATLTNPLGGVFKFSYGADGNLVSLQTPSGDTTKFAYDGASRVNLVTNPDGSTRSFQYDAMGNITGAMDERGNSIGVALDANNNLKTLTDALSKATTLAWDTDDRLTSATDPVGSATLQAWDAVSRLLSSTNAAGNSLTYSYDALNRVTQMTDASGNGFTYTRDAEGRLLSIMDALSRTTTLTRDTHGRVTGLTTPNKETFALGWDASNRLIMETDPLNRIAQYSWNAGGLLTGATMPGGVTALFGRNELGLIASVTDPNGNAWNHGFDNMGRETSSTDPLGHKTTFQYDARQRLSTRTFPTGNAKYTFDAAGNLTGQTYSDGTSLSYTYDVNGRLTGGTGLVLSYDGAGRINGSNGLRIARDPAGRIASITYAPGKAVNYTWDNRGLLTQVADWVGGATALAYDSAGQLTSVAYPNGVRADYTWDADGRLSSSKVSKGSTIISTITLHRDAVGRVVSADRTAANLPNVPSGFLSLAYDVASQVQGQSYDSLGRLTGDALRNYSWDLASRLASYRGSDGAASFTYDALGQRISRTSGGATQNYVLNYALPHPAVSTVQSGGADRTYYIWLPNGRLLASVAASNNARHFYHSDESGTVDALTDDSGNVTDSYAISPYGETLQQTGTTDNPFTFQGALGVIREGTTALYYMPARYYDSASARFLSRDPVFSTDPRAIDPYQFVYGNPVEHASAGAGGLGGPAPQASGLVDRLYLGLTSPLYSQADYLTRLSTSQEGVGHDDPLGPASQNQVKSFVDRLYPDLTSRLFPGLDYFVRILSSPGYGVELYSDADYLTRLLTKTEISAEELAGTFGSVLPNQPQSHVFLREPFDPIQTLPIIAGPLNGRHTPHRNRVR